VLYWYISILRAHTFIHRKQANGGETRRSYHEGVIFLRCAVRRKVPLPPKAYFTSAMMAVRYRETRALMPRDRTALGSLSGEAGRESLTVEVVLKSLELVLSTSLGFPSALTGTAPFGLRSSSPGVSCSLNHYIRAFSCQTYSSSRRRIRTSISHFAEALG
jgi:hypothetical protein